MMFQTKQHNTRSAFKATLYNKKGEPVVLTGCTVNFHMKGRSGNLVISREMQVGENGEVLLVFLPDEVAQPGHFNAEIDVIYPDGHKQIFPNYGYIKVEIQASLGGGQ